MGERQMFAVQTNRTDCMVDALDYCTRLLTNLTRIAGRTSAATSWQDTPARAMLRTRERMRAAGSGGKRSLVASSQSAHAPTGTAIPPTIQRAISVAFNTDPIANAARTRHPAFTSIQAA